MAVAVETVLFYADGKNVSCVTTAAVAAATFVAVSASRATTAVAPTLASNNISVAPAGAGVAALGVAMYTQATVGAIVGVRFVSYGGVLGVIAGVGGVTFGQEVQSDATGQAVTLAAGKSLGIALNTVAAGGIVQVALGR